jgi:uncharacterized membrane protein YsdA (DUF1294 family)
VFACWVLIVYLLIINLAGHGLARRDKRIAVSRRGGERVPEKTFHLLALLGGGIGTYLAFVTVRHKTRKYRFIVPFIFAMIGGAVLSAAWLALLCPDLLS